MGLPHALDIALRCSARGCWRVVAVFVFAICRFGLLYAGEIGSSMECPSQQQPCHGIDCDCFGLEANILQLSFLFSGLSKHS